MKLWCVYFWDGDKWHERDMDDSGQQLTDKTSRLLAAQLAKKYEDVRVYRAVLVAKWATGAVITLDGKGGQ